MSSPREISEARLNYCKKPEFDADTDICVPDGASASLPLLGPRPSLMIARESGINLVCQPLSDWNFCMAASVASSQ